MAGSIRRIGHFFCSDFPSRADNFNPPGLLFSHAISCPALRRTSRKCPGASHRQCSGTRCFTSWIETLCFGHEAVVLSLAEFSALPHITVTVKNGHSDAQEVYSGVRLADLMTKGLEHHSGSNCVGKR